MNSLKPTQSSLSGTLLHANSNTHRKTQKLDVEYPDVYNYLIDAPSPYTKKSLKSYKSLDGFIFLRSGWVGEMKLTKAAKDGKKVFKTAKVRHSQTVSSLPLDSWVAVEKDGTVICAHCTCMAGLGEACSHIAAVLLALDARTRHNEEAACTSLPCQWLPPSMKDVKYATIAETDFSSPAAKRNCASASAPSTRAALGDMTPTLQELHALHTRLSQVGRPALLSVVPGFCKEYEPKQPIGFPPLLTSLYEETMLGVGHDTLMDRCEVLFDSLSVSEAEAKAVEVASRSQASSKHWFRHRAG